MGKSQRRKGATFEREVLAEFSAVLGQKFNRLLGQARDGGADGKVGCLRVEMKRRGELARWYAQVVAAAQEAEIPMVVMREDGGKSLCLLSLDDLLKLVASSDLCRGSDPDAPPPTG